MITESYLAEVAQDIADKAVGVRINAGIVAAIDSSAVNRNTVLITAERTNNVGSITLAELLDVAGNVIARKETNLPAVDGLYTQIKFEFEVV